MSSHLEKRRGNDDRIENLFLEPSSVFRLRRCGGSRGDAFPYRGAQSAGQRSHERRHLASAGIKPEDVDAIILTHGHIDHLSGIMSADAKRLFPNAQLMMAKTEFDFWTDEAKTSATGVFKMLVDAARANLLPNKDRLGMVENGKEAVKGVQAVFTPGHTPGHTSYVLNAGGKSLLLTGDAVSHTAISFRHPDWAFSFDADPAGAIATRKQLLDMAVADNVPIIGYHFPFPGIGNVAKDGEAFRFVASPMTL